MINKLPPELEPPILNKPAYQVAQEGKLEETVLITEPLDQLIYEQVIPGMSLLLGSHRERAKITEVIANGKYKVILDAKD